MVEVRFLCLLLLRVESSNTICVWASQGVSPRSHDGQSQGEDNQFLDIDGADAIGGSNHITNLESDCSLGVE